MESVEFGSERAQSLLQRHGLVTLEAAMAFGRPLACRHRGRSISVGELADGETTVRVFVKKQNRVLQRVPRLTDLRHGTAFWPYPVCEWRGLALFRRAGLLTAEPLALVRQGAYSPRSAVLVQSLPCEQHLGGLIREGLLQRLDPPGRTALIEAVVGAIERIHRAGLGWRGMESKHFYPRLEPDGSWQIWLLDCEGVHRRATRGDVRHHREKFVDKLRAVQADEDFIADIARRLGT
jgi:hypothetical protein